MRNKRGQTALEYAALITVLAGIVAYFLLSSGTGSLKSKINDTYNAAVGKVSTAQGWLTNTMKPTP
jgi:Flp pilus assembly pilin Flp